MPGGRRDPHTPPPPSLRGSGGGRHSQDPSLRPRAGKLSARPGPRVPGSSKLSEPTDPPPPPQPYLCSAGTAAPSAAGCARAVPRAAAWPQCPPPPGRGAAAGPGPAARRGAPRTWSRFALLLLAVSSSSSSPAGCCCCRRTRAQRAARRGPAYRMCPALLGAECRRRRRRVPQISPPSPGGTRMREPSRCRSASRPMAAAARSDRPPGAGPALAAGCSLPPPPAPPAPLRAAPSRAGLRGVTELGAGTGGEGRFRCPAALSSRCTTWLKKK